MNARSLGKLDHLPTERLDGRFIPFGTLRTQVSAALEFDPSARSNSYVKWALSSSQTWRKEAIQEKKVTQNYENDQYF
jgi:hypothetical protein